MTSEPGARLRLAVVLGAALVVRVLAAVQFDGAKLAGDETYYVTLADAVASGDGHPSAWRPPLYTLFLGVVIWVWPTLTAGIAMRPQPSGFRVPVDPSERPVPAKPNSRWMLSALVREVPSDPAKARLLCAYVARHADRRELEAEACEAYHDAQ